MRKTADLTEVTKSIENTRKKKSETGRLAMDRDVKYALPYHNGTREKDRLASSIIIRLKRGICPGYYKSTRISALTLCEACLTLKTYICTAWINVGTHIRRGSERA